MIQTDKRRARQEHRCRITLTILLLLWIGIAFILTDLQYRHVSAPLMFAVSFFLLASAPLLPGIVARRMRPFMNAGFYRRDMGSSAQIHLSPWANARCRHPRDVVRLKTQLNQCIADALKCGRPVTIRSHLLSYKRTDEIVCYLTAQGIEATCTHRVRPTPPLERILLILIYIMADHRYPQISRTGLDVTLIPLQPQQS